MTDSKMTVKKLSEEFDKVRDKLKKIDSLKQKLLI